MKRQWKRILAFGLLLMIVVAGVGCNKSSSSQTITKYISTLTIRDDKFEALVYGDVKTDADLQVLLKVYSTDPSAISASAWEGYEDLKSTLSEVGGQNYEYQLGSAYEHVLKLTGPVRRIKVDTSRVVRIINSTGYTTCVEIYRGDTTYLTGGFSDIQIRDDSTVVITEGSSHGLITMADGAEFHNDDKGPARRCPGCSYGLFGNTTHQGECGVTGHYACNEYVYSIGHMDYVRSHRSAHSRVFDCQKHWLCNGDPASKHEWCGVCDEYYICRRHSHMNSGEAVCLAHGEHRRCATEGCIVEEGWSCTPELHGVCEQCGEIACLGRDHQARCELGCDEYLCTRDVEHTVRDCGHCIFSSGDHELCDEGGGCGEYLCVRGVEHTVMTCGHCVYAPGDDHVPCEAGGGCGEYLCFREEEHQIMDCGHCEFAAGVHGQCAVGGGCGEYLCARETEHTERDCGHCEFAPGDDHAACDVGGGCGEYLCARGVHHTIMECGHCTFAEGIHHKCNDDGGCGEYLCLRDVMHTIRACGHCEFMPGDDHRACDVGGGCGEYLCVRGVSSHSAKACGHCALTQGVHDACYAGCPYGYRCEGDHSACSECPSCKKCVCSGGDHSECAECTKSMCDSNHSLCDGCGKCALTNPDAHKECPRCGEKRCKGDTHEPFFSCGSHCRHNGKGYEASDHTPCPYCNKFKCTGGDHRGLLCSEHCASNGDPSVEHKLCGFCNQGTCNGKEHGDGICNSDS